LNRHHLWLLLLATLLVQGIMFISYPLGAGSNNDNESAQKYLISEYAKGNFLVGNVRYNTGYALVMAPFKTLTDHFDRWSERALLLLQILASSAVPFLVYDIMRRRFEGRCALLTAMLVLVDPFNLQWAHFQLPGWLLALATVSALWLAQLAWSAPRRRALRPGAAALAVFAGDAVACGREQGEPAPAAQGGVDGAGDAARGQREAVCAVEPIRARRQQRQRVQRIDAAEPPAARATPAAPGAARPFETP